MNDVWEPFVWAIGQRVRVRLSAECAFRYRKGYGHAPGMDGRVGVVEEHLCADQHDPAHRVYVVFTPWVMDESLYVSHCFAAAELEPAP